MTVLPKMWKTYGRTLYLKKYDTLIVSDIHLGKCISENCDIAQKYDEKYNRLNKIIENTETITLILNGDIFYCSSNYFNNQMEEDEYALNILHKLNDKVDELILLEGNHELVLGGFTDNICVCFNVKPHHKIDDILIHHGHKIGTSEENINHHIIGHIHPTIDGNAVFHYSEKGYKNKSVTILPAFCKIVDSVNINYYGGICPLFENGIDSNNYKTILI